ncbi:MAG TPA: DUF1697 domain-containing protein [Acidimicrobiia bacterium]|nr:DUF1697 domain-containing protein [Acidimicrobiia bacterium]
MRYAAFLRGVNLGPSRKVKMAELRSLLERMSLEDVGTYLQSGNAVFTAENEAAGLVERLEGALAAEFGIEIAVVVRDQSEMTAVVDGCPYQDEAAADPKKVHAVFLGGSPPAAVWKSVDADAFRPDEFTVGDRVVYMHLPNGMARTKLPAALEKAASGVTATTRNWRTVEAVNDLLA